MRLKGKKWKWRNKQMNKHARLSDSRDFTDFTLFTTNKKPPISNERREKKKG
jgi:hypothetical protein